MVQLPDKRGCELVTMAPPKRPMLLSAQTDERQRTSEMAERGEQNERDMIGADVRLQIPLADMSITQLRELSRAMQDAWAMIEAITLRDSTVHARDFVRERIHVMFEAKMLLRKVATKYLPRGKGGRPRNM